MRSAAIALAALSASLLVPDSTVLAQELPQPGERVRVTLLPTCTADLCTGRPRRKSVGTLMSVSGDSLLLSVNGGADRVFLPLSSVVRIQVLRGRKPARVRGAVIGALVGGVVGMVGSLTTYEECEGFCPANFGRGGTAALSGLVFGALGAGVGYLVGNFVTVDRWVEVPPDRLRVSIAPQRDGRLTLGMSVSF